MANVNMLAPPGLNGVINTVDGSQCLINNADGAVSVPQVAVPSLLASGFVIDTRGITDPPFGLNLQRAQAFQASMYFF